MKADAWNGFPLCRSGVCHSHSNRLNQRGGKPDRRGFFPPPKWTHVNVDHLMRAAQNGQFEEGGDLRKKSNSEEHFHDFVVVVCYIYSVNAREWGEGGGWTCEWKKNNYRTWVNVEGMRFWEPPTYLWKLLFLLYLQELWSDAVQSCHYLELAVPEVGLWWTSTCVERVSDRTTDSTFLFPTCMWNKVQYKKQQRMG